MSTLSLKPEVAAARRAARLTQHTNPPPIVAPDAPSASRGAYPASQVKGDRGHRSSLPQIEEVVRSNKAAKKAAMRELQRRLKAIWPHLFGNDSTPLAIGIRHDIARHLSPAEQKVLPAVLHQHVHRPAYLAALQQPGAHRVGLDGTLTPVSQEQAEHARVALGMPAPPIVQQRATVQDVGVLPVRAATRRKASA